MLQLTVFSLYAAISVGLTASELLKNLTKLSKNHLPKELVQQIENVAAAFGKVSFPTPVVVVVSYSVSAAVPAIAAAAAAAAERACRDSATAAMHEVQFAPYERLGFRV